MRAAECHPLFHNYAVRTRLVSKEYLILLGRRPQ